MLCCRSCTVQYFNFSGQAKLWNRNLTDDRRDALDYIPCERCRLRGGRCARCKAIRTGGGYIILDGDDLSNDDLQRKFGNREAFVILNHSIKSFQNSVIIILWGEREGTISQKSSCNRG